MAPSRGCRRPNLVAGRRGTGTAPAVGNGGRDLPERAGPNGSPRMEPEIGRATSKTMRPPTQPSSAESGRETEGHGDGPLRHDPPLPKSLKVSERTLDLGRNGEHLGTGLDSHRRAARQILAPRREAHPRPERWSREDLPYRTPRSLLARAATGPLSRRTPRDLDLPEGTGETESSESGLDHA